MLIHILPLPASRILVSLDPTRHAAIPDTGTSRSSPAAHPSIDPTDPPAPRNRQTPPAASVLTSCANDLVRIRHTSRDPRVVEAESEADGRSKSGTGRARGIDATQGEEGGWCRGVDAGVVKRDVWWW